MIWHRFRNKNDVDDILMDAKVDNQRIYQPVAAARRVKMKNEKTKLIKKYQKLNMIINLKALKYDDYVKCVI